MIKRAPVKAKRKQVEPRQTGVFKRFTLLVVDYIREKFVWAKKKPAPVPVDAEHERRTRFNSDNYSPTPDEIRRFPSRYKQQGQGMDDDIGIIYTIQTVKKAIPMLKPPTYRK